ncbi:protein lethal(2)essential for life [Aedes aegypti]|uniref:Heat shock protein n=1 Tax=Aedes aegypti TaxID=7159 RepID=A7UDX2_AEDAE|nr:protein lethal(2)essential for life [Aedes aegypti]ABU49236.1 heat shock protein [Aedes aegypti]
MVLLPTILFSDLWDGCLDSPIRSSQIRCQHLDRQPFPGGFLVTFDDAPKKCDRKPCCRTPSQRKNEGNKQEAADKAPTNFQVNLNVQEFQPEDISVKATSQFVIVEAKHEEKDAENGYVLRQFVRRYRIPEGHDSDRIESTLSSDGVLTISAPVLALPAPEKEHSVMVNHVKVSTADEKQCTKENKNYTLEDLDE